MRPSLKARVERRLGELGITPAEATRRGGLGRTLIYEIINGVTRHVRVDTAAKLARGLDCDIGYLTGGQSEPRMSGATQARTSTALVVGDIGAGVWHETSTFTRANLKSADEMDTSETVPVIPLPEFHAKEHYAVRVVGPSVNRAIGDGEYAIFIPLEQTSGQIPENALVIVERNRHGLYECTIKRFRRTPSGPMLCPDSDDPRYQAPITLNESLDHEAEHADVAVTIKGIVVARYAHL